MSNAISEPQSLSDILGELVVVRGYGRAWARQVLENAWNTAVGEPQCYQTQIGELRHGILNVIVANSTLLEELVAFRKVKLVASLRSGALGTAIHDIRFRVGSVVFDIKQLSE
jgi:Dna[CI] antecedent, DciA